MTEAVGLRSPRIYNLFPLLVGPTREWCKQVPRIASMGFNWIYVNPFHFPGFSGSLYAVKDYYRLNPMFRGSSYENDDDLLRDFLDTCSTHGLRVMMDLVINHTARDAVLTTEHPEWYLRDEAGDLCSPYAADPDDPHNPEKRTVWGDLAEIDFTPRPERDALTAYFQRVARHYVRLGVRGFRCDAAYKVPAEVWLAVIDACHEEDPDVLFFAETLGCRQDEAEALRPARFDYFFNSSKWWDFKAPWLLEQYEALRDIAPSIAFPESHDTPRLAADLEAQGITDRRDLERAYRQHYLFTAAFSAGVMMPIGFEFGFARPLHVVDSRPGDWETPRFDLTDFVRAVNRMKAEHSVLNREGPQWRVDSPTGALGLMRRNDHGDEWVLTVVNPDDNGPWSLETDGSDPVGAIAALGHEITPGRDGPTFDQAGGLALAPGDIRLFTGTAPLP
jgi:starch synthase (maltosyl-transferring)